MSILQYSFSAFNHFWLWKCHRRHRPGEPCLVVGTVHLPETRSYHRWLDNLFMFIDFWLIVVRDKLYVFSWSLLRLYFRFKLQITIFFDVLCSNKLNEVDDNGWRLSHSYNERVFDARSLYTCCVFKYMSYTDETQRSQTNRRRNFNSAIRKPRFKLYYYFEVFKLNPCTLWLSYQRLGRFECFITCKLTKYGVY